MLSLQKLTATRDGSEILLKIRFADVYEAIRMHDQMGLLAQKTGEVKIRITGAYKVWAHEEANEDFNR